MTLRWFSRAILSTGLLLGLWAFWWEPGSLRKANYTLNIPQWPQPCSGLRIAVLADPHTGSPYNGLDKLNEIVDLTLQAQPDLILLAGDYVVQEVLGGQFIAPEDMTPVLARLEAPMGVYAVLGNHDWWLDGARVRQALEQDGIPVLEDTAINLTHGDCRFWLAGISDFWEAPHDIAATLARIPAATPVLAFTHNPDIFPVLPSRITLTIAGHTHGGQVYFPVLGRLIVPSHFGERFAIGHIQEADRHMFVSPGLGTSILPVRFLVPPEISILHVLSGGTI
ncbi:MAG: metallophosphoesterase [Gammaproteobacteria bacterium]